MPDFRRAAASSFLNQDRATSAFKTEGLSEPNLSIFQSPEPKRIIQAPTPKLSEKEQRRADIEARVDFRVEAFSERLREESLDNDGFFSRPGFFRGATKLAGGALKTKAFKETVVYDELGYWGYQKNNLVRARNLVIGTAELGAMILQDIPLGVSTIALSLVSESGELLTGGKFDADKWSTLQSDSVLYKIIYGREVERDLFGKAISSKGRTIKTLEEMRRESAEFIKAAGGTERQVSIGSLIGGPALVMLEITPILGVDAMISVSKNKAKLTVELVSAVDVGKNLTGDALTILKKEAAAAAKAAVSAADLKKSQKFIDDFIIKNTPEGSAARKAIEERIRLEKLDTMQSRAELVERAGDATTYKQFVDDTTNFIRTERASQTAALTNRAAKIASDPVYREALNEVGAIFTKYGDETVDVTLGQLRADTPDKIVKAYDNLITKVKDIEEVQLGALDRNARMLSDSIPIGEGLFDITRPLLNAEPNKSLTKIMKEIFEASRTEKVTALQVIDGTKGINQLGSDKLLGAITNIDKLVQNIRAKKIFGRNTISANSRIAREASLRGLIPRRQLLEEGNQILRNVPENKFDLGAGESIKNINIINSNALAKATNDALSSKTVEEFIAKSSEIMYFGPSTKTFTHSKTESLKFADEIGDVEGFATPFILDIKNPIDLRGETAGFTTLVHSYLRPSEISNAKTRQKLIDALIPKISDRYDGILYKNADGVEMRAMTEPKNKVTAAEFFEKIKAGDEAFGGIPTKERGNFKATSPVLEPVLPFSPTINSLKLPGGIAGKAETKAIKASLHADILGHLLENGMEGGIRNDIRSVVQDTSGVLPHTLYINSNRITIKTIKSDGTEVITEITKTKAQTDKLVNNIKKDFHDDAIARVQDMETVGVSVEAFNKMGPGHTRFNRSINKHIEEGTFLPEEGAALREIFKDTDDYALSNIAPLNSTEALKSATFSGNKNIQGMQSGFDISMRRGVAYRDLFQSLKVENAPLVRDGRLANGIFLHEVGHYGHTLLLDSKQNALIRKVWMEMRNTEKIDDFFRGGASEFTGLKHYNSSEHEFFAQAFSEYIQKNKVPDSRLLDIFQQISRRLGGAISRLMKREDPGEMAALTPLFEQVLRGERSVDSIHPTKSLGTVSKKLALSPESLSVAMQGSKTNGEIFDSISKALNREHTPAEIAIVREGHSYESVVKNMMSEMGYYGPDSKKIKTTKAQAGTRIEKARTKGIVSDGARRTAQTSTAIKKIMKAEQAPGKVAPELKGLPIQPPKNRLPKGFKTPVPDSDLYTAKIPKGISQMSVITEDSIGSLIAMLEKKNIFGKGVRTSSAVTKGQRALVGRLKAMQKQIIKKNDALIKLNRVSKAQKKKELDALRAKAKNETGRRALSIQMIKVGEKELDDFAKSTLPLLPGDKVVPTKYIDKVTGKVVKEEIVRSKAGTSFNRQQANVLRERAARVKTKKDTEKLVDDIIDFIETQKRKFAAKRIEDINTHIGVAGIHPSWQDKIDKVLSKNPLLFKDMDDDVRSKLEQLRDFLLVKPEKEFDFRSFKTKAQLEKIKDLDKTKLDDVSTEDLINMWVDIETLAANGKMAQDLIDGYNPGRAIKKTEFVGPDGKIIKDETIVVTTSNPGYIPGIKRLQEMQILDEIERAKMRGNVRNLDTESPAREKYGDLNSDISYTRQAEKMIKNLGSNLKKKTARGEMHYLSADRVFELIDNMNETGLMARLIREPLRKAINAGEDAAEFQLKALKKTEERIVEKYKLGKTGLTDANYERISIHAYHMQGLDKKMENSGFKWEMKNGKKIFPEIEAAKVLLPHEKEMYEYMRLNLDALYNGVDTTMREVHGIRLNKTKNYFPVINQRFNARMVKDSDGRAIVDVPSIKDAMLMEHSASKRSVSRGFTKERMNILGPEKLQMNAREIYMKHVRDAQYFVHAERDIQRISKITRDEKFRNTVGANVSDWTEGYIDMVARRGMPKNYNYNWIDIVRKNVGIATLGFNPSPIIKQPLAAATGMAIVGPMNYFKGLFTPLKYASQTGDNVITAGKKISKAISERSVELRRRAFDDPAYTDLSLSGKLSELQEKGYAGIKWADMRTAETVWLGAYIKEFEKGGRKTFNMQDFIDGKKINDAALTKADRVTRKTQGSGKFQDLPTMLSGKDKKIFGAVFQFQSFILGQSQVITHDVFRNMVHNLRKGGMTEQEIIKELVGDTSKLAIIGGGLTAEGYLTYMLAMTYGSENWKEEQEDMTKGQRAFEIFKSAIPPIGIAVNIANPSSSGTGVPIIDKPIQGAKGLVGMFIKDETEAKIKDGTRFMETALGVAAGVPGTGFAGSVIRGQRGVESWFETPAEQLAKTIESGSKDDAVRILNQAMNDGLDADKIAAKAKRIYESELKKDRKMDVEKSIKMLEGVDSDERLNLLREMVISGAVDEAMFKDINSYFKSEFTKKQLGE